MSDQDQYASLALSIDARAARKGSRQYVKSLKTVMSISKRTVTSVDKVIRSINPLSSAMGKLATVLGSAGITYALYNSIKSYSDFEYEIAAVNTLLDESTEHYIPNFEKSIRAMSREFGQSTATLNKGLYDTISASVEAADAMDFLDVTVRTAVGGMTDTGIVADVLTTILNSYALSADKAEYVSDILFTTVKRGKTTMGELASGLGMVASLSSVAGLSLEELNATLATMTRAGVKTDMAITSINAILTGFLAPTDDAKAAAAELGLELSSATIKAKGLSGVIEQLNEISPEMLARILPNVRGLRGMAAALKDAEGNAADLKAMMNSSGATMAAYNKVASTSRVTMERFKYTIIDVKRIFGEAFLEQFVDSLDEVQSSLENNRAEITLWANLSAIEVTRLTDYFKAFASYMKDDFAGATDVAFDVLIASFTTVSKAVINLAYRTGGAIVEAIKTGIFKSDPYTTDELFSRTNALYEAAGGTRSKAPGSDGLFYSGPQLVEDDLELWNKSQKEAIAQFQEEQMTQFVQGYDKDLSRYKNQFANKFSDIIEDASSTSEAGSVFSDQLSSADEKALSSKAAARKKYLDEISKTTGIEEETQAINDQTIALKDLTTQEVASISVKERFTDEQKEHIASVNELLTDLKNELRLVNLTNDARERAITLTKYQKLVNDAYGESSEEANDKLSKYMELLDKLENARELKQVADDVGDAFSDAMSDMILGAKSASEAMSDLSLAVAELVLQQTVLTPVANSISSLITSTLGADITASAQGNVTGGSGISAYSNKIVSSPTIFPFANGVGLMGEAGEEAIMPLTRMGNGNLGVESSTSSPQVTIEQEINIENNTSSQVSASSETKFEFGKMVTTIILEDFNSNGSISSGVKSLVSQKG